MEPNSTRGTRMTRVGRKLPRKRVSARKNGKSTQAEKRKFRASREWKEFRDKMREKQKVDPVTGQKLTRMANLHHKCLDEEKYEDISDEDNFVFVNHLTHKVIHFFFSKSNPSQWRERWERLKPILESMEKINTVPASEK